MQQRRQRNTLRRRLTMPRLSLALLAAAAIAVACYKDDVTTVVPNSGKPMAKVLLTDDPFPFDSVRSVQVCIVNIAVSTHPDTGTSADSMHWVTVAAPHRQVDLLTLQQGLTDSLGIGEVSADQRPRYGCRHRHRLRRGTQLRLQSAGRRRIRFLRGDSRGQPSGNGEYL